MKLYLFLCFITSLPRTEPARNTCKVWCTLGGTKTRFAFLPGIQLPVTSLRICPAQSLRRSLENHQRQVLCKFVLFENSQLSMTTQIIPWIWGGGFTSLCITDFCYHICGCSREGCCDPRCNPSKPSLMLFSKVWAMAWLPSVLVLTLLQGVISYVT